MSNPLPHRPSIEHTPSQRVTLELGDESSGAMLDALGSDTARSVLEWLKRGPATASDVANNVDVSVQTASYHLHNLVGAGLVAKVGTWYSSKGAEMDVYALTSERVEIRLGYANGEPSPQPSLDKPTPSPIALENE